MAAHGIAAPKNDDEEKMKYPPNSDIQSLIVCLKTTSTIEALSVLRPRLSPSSVITLIQNGMGVFDELCASLWPDPMTRPQFILGTTTHGAKRAANVWSIHHATKPGSGDMRFGIVPDPRKEVNFEKWIWGETVGNLPILDPPPVPPIPLPPPPKSVHDFRPMRATLEALLSMNQLSPSLLPMPHLHHQLLLKLAINAVINPLTAVLGGGSIPNGALFGSAPGHRLIRALTREVTAVLTAYLHSLSAPHSPAPDVLRLFSANSLESRILSVIRSTAENSSSMATDVSNGRLTEITHINGYLIALGKRLGVDTPNHQMVYEMVRFTSEINGLSPKMPVETVKRVAERRAFLRKGLNMDRGPRTPEEIEIRQRQLEIEERKVWIEEAKLREQRAARRAGKRVNHVRALLSQDEDVIAEQVPTFRPANWEEKSERGKSRYLRKARRRAEKQEAKGVAGVGADSGLQQDMPGSYTDNKFVQASPVIPSDSTESTRSPSAAPPKSTTPPAKLSVKKGSWMDDLIASAPRQERTWEILPAPPTARGPLPKKKESKAASPTSAGSSAEEKAKPPVSGSMKDMMSSMIASAPRQTDPSASEASSSPSTSAPPSIAPTPSSSSAPSHASTFSRSSSTASPFTSSLDSLISAAPRAVRDWDVKGGTVSGYTGTASTLAPTVGTARIQGKDLSRGGLGSSLDGLIASSPRQERTWDVAPVTMKSDGGKFTTSRTSGS